MHFTETCDEELPRLITQITTTIAPTPDRQALPEIHEVLEQRQLLPEQHLVDAGYTDAESLVASQQEYQVDLVGPTAKDYRWQAQQQNGYALTNFSIDWEQEQARCPQGQTSSSWTPTRTRNQEIIKMKFGFASCGACPVRSEVVRRPSGEASPCGDKKRILHEMLPDNESRQKSSSKNMRSEQV